MATTQADIDALEARINAIAGVQQTTMGDQSTSFDLEGGRARLAEMRRELRTATQGSVRYASTSKGV